MFLAQCQWEFANIGMVVQCTMQVSSLVLKDEIKRLIMVSSSTACLGDDARCFCPDKSSIVHGVIADTI